MRTLSVRQPWAWLIVAGYKTVENRTWSTTYRGPLLIHASRKIAFGAADMSAFRQVMQERAGIVIPADLPTGGIVGIADLVDCTLTPDDPERWHEPGCYAFVLRNARPLAFEPMPGKLGLFET